MNLRPELYAMAQAMERTLRKHDRERGSSYRQMNPHDLLDRLKEERKELSRALRLCTYGMMRTATPRAKLLRRRRVTNEAVDVANFAMMIALVAGDLEAEATP